MKKRICATMLAFTLGLPVVFGASPMVLHAEAIEIKAQTMQADVTFPKTSLDSSLALNNLVSFKGYKGQGKIYVTTTDVESVDIYVNGKVLVSRKPITSGSSTEVDISSYTNNDVNTIQVTNIQPSTGKVNIKIPFPVVISDAPKAVGARADKLAAIDLLLKKEVEYGFPGGQLVVIKDGVMIKNTAYGSVNAYEQDGTRIKNPIPVTTKTLYDLASNTKMYSVNYALQMLVSQGLISVDDKITKYFPEFKDEDYAAIKGKANMTIRHILQHQAGFAPDPQYFNESYDKDDGIQNGKNDLFSQNKKTTEQMILKTPLSYVPGTETKYSDVDYMLLGMIIEKVTGQELDKFVENNIYNQIGLDKVMFNPLKKGVNKSNIAATELNGNSRDGAVSFINNRTYTVQGEVHDEKAFYSMDGVSGHAGLFSNAEQLGKLAQVMLNGGGYGDVKFFDTNTIDQFVKPKDSNVTYGLGWRRQGDNGYAWAFGEQASNATYGHTGWTGTLSIIDPENDLVIIWLGNKKNSPVVDNATNPNYFYGDHFQGGEYGAIPLLVYEALKNTDVVSTDALLVQMALNKMDVIKARANYKNYADYEALKALVDVVVSRAEMVKTPEYISRAKSVVNALYIPSDNAKANFLNRLDRIK